MHSLVLLGFLLAQDSKPPEWVKFDVARERIGHRVVVDAELKNPSAAELAGLKITAIYYEGDREMRRSKPVAIAKIAPGATAAFKIEADQVPNFTRAEIYVEAGAVTRLYHASDAVALPSLKAPEKASMVLVSQKMAPLTVVVRNSGGIAADEPTAALTFRSGASVVHQIRVRLEKSVGASSEEIFEITVPGVPAHSSVDVTVACQASDEMTLADAGGAKEVTLRQCRTVRLTDASARVSGVLANGTGVAVRNVSAKFQLGKLEAPYTLPGVLKPGESRPFVFYVPGCAPFESVSFDLSFDAAGPAEAVADAPGAPTSRRTSTKKVESSGAKLPPLPPKPAEDAAASAELRPPSVGIRGLLVSEGVRQANGKYTGDIYLMRMVFLDSKGKPYQPEATVQFTLYDGPKEVRKSQRAVTRASWGVDAASVNGAKLDFDTVAFDRKANELWVGLHWTDKAFAKPRADIVVEIAGVGKYEFKDVANQWVAAPRYPDSK